MPTNPSTEPAENLRRKCREPGCTKQLRPDNKIGYCKRHKANHYYKQNRKARDESWRQRPCQQCGADLSGKQQEAKFCSVACRQRAHLQRHRQVNIGSCEGCGAVLIGHRRSTKFCTRDCGRRFRHRQRQIITAVTRQCEGCGADLIGRRRDTKFCSRSCQYQANKATIETQRAKRAVEQYGDRFGLALLPPKGKRGPKGTPVEDRVYFQIGTMVKKEIRRGLEQDQHEIERARRAVASKTRYDYGTIAEYDRKFRQLAEGH